VADRWAVFESPTARSEARRRISSSSPPSVRTITKHLALAPYAASDEQGTPSYAVRTPRHFSYSIETHG